MHKGIREITESSEPYDDYSRTDFDNDSYFLRGSTYFRTINGDLEIKTKRVSGYASLILLATTLTLE
ncbi:hypothetical protein HZH66_014100 [Vespula vulgaris]|uniref:Uncharacterized protein n=1 Tax=Vespula vulgaris TaxID=7454 RepID=A0A834J2R9_VESVU|nr:hypothetical protein HZH66_014100 [Vespula vulgaris]